MMVFLLLLAFLNFTIANPSPLVPRQTAFILQNSQSCYVKPIPMKTNNFTIMKSDGSDDENQSIEPETPETSTLFGLEKKQDFDPLNTGVPPFTGIVILGMNIYLIYILLTADVVPSEDISSLSSGL